LNLESKFKDKTNDVPRLSLRVKERMSMIPPDENYSFVDGTQWQVQGRNISFIYRRSHPLKPAWTVMANGGGGTYGYHYERNRSQLTLRERARIQSFCDSFVFKGSGIRAQIGEAVPPLMSRKIAELIAEKLDDIWALITISLFLKTSPNMHNSVSLLQDYNLPISKWFIQLVHS